MTIINHQPLNTNLNIRYHQQPLLNIHHQPSAMAVGLKMAKKKTANTDPAVDFSDFSPQVLVTQCELSDDLVPRIIHALDVG